MSEGFPTYSKAAQRGDRGVDLVSRIFNEKFGWLFKRNHQEHDFGIDAQVDVVLEDGAVTGQILALQIKYGSSFVKEKNKWGFVYRGESKHFNYLANYPVPVLIVVCDPESSNCYWVEFKPESTRRAGENWTITVPFKNTLANDYQRIAQLLPVPADYLSEIEAYWAMNDIISSRQHFLFIIDLEQIETLDTSEVRAFFDRISMTRELADHCQGKVELSFDGFNDDPRELFEIPEMRAFSPRLSHALPELFFFAYTGERNQGLRTIALCLTSVTKRTDVKTTGNKIYT